MQQNNNNKKQKKRQRNNNAVPAYDNGLQIYRGPITIPGTSSGALPIKENATYFFSVTTDAGGAINLVLGSSPAVLNEWTAWTGLYHEYRVLALELTIVPVVNNAALSYGPAISVVDRATATSLGSYAAGANHDSAKYHSLYKKFSRQARMMGSTESAWIDVTSPISQMFIKVYAGLSTPLASIAVGFLKYLIEFRTKG